MRAELFLFSSCVHRNLKNIYLNKFKIMGQSTSNVYKDVLPDALQFQIAKHSKILSELSDLTYDDFQKCVDELNEL
jgi:hypothetical protein